MFSKLILLNSAKFSKAVIDLGQDLQTVQLVGNNRYGKTSILNALNFLFVPDPRQLGTLFGDHTFQQTLDYYFPSENNSFILYEIYKNGFFTILVKTNSGKLAYYKYNQEYKDEYFFDKNNRLLKFTEIQANFLISPFELEQINNSQDYLNFAYSRDKKKNSCVVWLEKTVKSKGLSNPFTEMYKCLIKPKLINNETLKEALITCDNRNEKYDLEFSKGTETDLLTLQRYLDEVKRIKEISIDFFSFKKLVDDVNSKQTIIEELYYVFLNLYETEILVLDGRIKDCDTQIQLLDSKLKSKLIPELKDFIEKKGIENQKQRTCEDQQKKLENKLKEIGKLETLEFLKHQKDNLDKERTEKEFESKKIEKENSTEAGILNEISKTKTELKHINNDIIGNSDKLIQHISNDEKTRQLLNRILTDEVKRLPQISVITKIKTLTQTFNIEDGKIDISALSPLPFETIEELHKRRGNCEKKLNNLTITLNVIQDREKFEKELQEIKDKIEKTERKIRLLGEEEGIRTELGKEKKNETNTKADIQALGKQIETVEGKITDAENDCDKYKSKKLENELLRNNLLSEYNNLKLKEIFPKSNQSERIDIDDLVKELNKRCNEVESLKERKKDKFNELKKRSDKHTIEEIFIQEIEEEITTLQQKEDSIQGLLQSLAERFSNPADRLLKGFQEFQDNFIRSFNTQLSKIRISDRGDIKLIIKPVAELIEDIKTLREIRELKPDDLFAQSSNNKDGLTLLKKWLEADKKVNFENLFDIEAQILVEGKTRKIDFGKEVESGGTNRMLKFIIFLSIIKKLVINTLDNRIPFCIDETLMIDTQNQEQLIRFCVENHFLPIFAAPEPVKSNIDRFYYLMPNSKGDKMFVINTKKI